MRRFALPLACLALAAAPVLAACGGGDSPGQGEQIETAVLAAMGRTEVGGDAKRLDVSAIDVKGRRATAEVAFAGGGLDGQALALSLVRKDGQWDLDRIVGFATLDADALAESIERRFEAASGDLAADQVECLGDAIRDAPRREVETLLLGDSEAEFLEFAEACG
ncbi:MAG: hypothetical protein R2725_10920 [Solirubrobacterales bacterium]